MTFCFSCHVIDFKGTLHIKLYIFLKFLFIINGLIFQISRGIFFSIKHSNWFSFPLFQFSLYAHLDHAVCKCLLVKVTYIWTNYSSCFDKYMHSCG